MRTCLSTPLISRWLFVVLLTLGLSLSACSSSEDEDDDGGEDVSEQDDVIQSDTGGQTEPGEVPDTSVSPVDFCADLPAAGEGDIGFWHRGGTECYGGDEDPVAGDTIHLAPDGDDDGAGTEDAPFGTLARALCGAQPGQTIKVHPGTYHQSVLAGQIGDASAPITLSGVADGDARPVFDGGGCYAMGLLLIESANVVIEGLEFRGYTDEGMYVASSEQVTISGCLFEKNGFDSVDPDFNHEGFGLSIGNCSDVTIKDNECNLNGPKPDIYAQAVLGMGIDTFELTDAEITGNHVHHTVGGGILVEEGVNVDVKDNEIDHNHLDAAGDYWDGGIWIDGGHHVSATGNDIHDNVGPGIQISDADAKFPYFSCHYTVTGNTIKDNYWALYTMNFGQCPLPSATVLVWEDNTVSDNDYPGDGWAKDASYEGGILCEDWACGEGQPCTDDDFDTSVKHCE